MGSSGLTGYHNVSKAEGPGVVVGRSGNSMGVVSFTPRDYWPLNTCLYVTDFKGNDERFIYYYLQGIDFDQFNSGSAQKSLNRNFIYPYQIKFPNSLSEQRAISGMLASLEEKIELNRQMNGTLEQMAQALFKSWFVDFDPVIDNALDAGNLIPEELEARAEQRRQLRNAVAQGEASVLGMPDEIRSLFPSEFELADDMGWIPKGWKAGKLHDLLVLQRGFDLPKTKRTEGPYPLIASSGQDGVHGDFKVEGPGLVTGRSGRIGVVNFVYDNFWPLNTTLWVKEFSASSPYHGFFQLKGIDLENYATGSAVPTLNRNHVHEHPCVVAPKTILDVFDKHAETLFCRVRSNDESNQTLARIRDYLLPKLISGELQIPDAEQQIAEALS
jgi:type I restriction enzyme S subunit